MPQRERQKRDSRDSILRAAAASVRERGLEATGVANVMADAGLTHGGFYAHFASKDDLLAAALEKATEHRDVWLDVDPEAPEPVRLKNIAERYLNAGHRDAPRHGCPYPSVLAEAGRLPKSTAATLRREADRTIATLADRLDDEKNDESGPESLSARDKARAVTALLIGAMQLARLFDDEESDRILAAARTLAMRATTNPEVPQE